MNIRRLLETSNNRVAIPAPGDPHEGRRTDRAQIMAPHGSTGRSICRKLSNYLQVFLIILVTLFVKLSLLYYYYTIVW